MKNFKTFTILVVLVFSSYLSFSSSNQGNWRWRNDDGNETTATCKADEKTPFNLGNYENFRLGVEMFNDDENETTASTFVLGYSTDDVNYTTITNDPATNYFVCSLSGNFEDSATTTKQLTGGQANYKAGNMFEVFHNDFSPELTPKTSMELEFCIKATTNVKAGTYYFKVYDYNGTVLNGHQNPLPTLNFITRRYVTQKGAGTKDGLSWANAYEGTQLQAAINEPLVTEVWVAAGLYKPTTGADRTISLQMKNGVAIYGGFVGNEDDLSDRDIEANPTILSGDLLDDDVITGSGSTLSITGNSENSFHVIFNPASLALTNQAILDGFKLTGGNANGAFPNYIGGVICNNGSSPTIRNCTINGNYGHWGGGIANFGASPKISDCEISSNIALYYGAGVFNFYSSAPELTNCTIDKNKADFGGAMYNESSGPTLTDCMISENLAIKGGGVCNHASSPTFTNCTFSTNQASENGGGMYNTTNTLTFDGCTFDANTAKNGGAMFDILNNNSILTNCIIKTNQSAESGGGGFWVHDACQIILTNCLVHDNTSPTWGGGMIILPGATGTLINCTFSQNASGLGGGLYNSGGTYVINNSILWGNTSTQWGNQIETTAGISTTLNYSCFANVYGPDTWDVEGPIVNNASINSNPTFINPGTDDFSVRGNSPCVNAGFNTYNSETTDIRGEERIQNTIDMGAYEWTAGIDPAYESVFVKQDASGNNDGTDWANAFNLLQSALEKTLINGDKIWVAAGTYTPTSANGMDPGDTNPRLKHFRMMPGVAIYGCFEGTEDVETYDLSLRDFVNNQSLLSGNIGLPNDSTDNCYHVFYHPDGLGLTSSSLLNGFEIREAVANGENDFKDGAGMMNINNSPALTLCRFTKNYSADRGGAVYNSGSNPEFRRVRFTKNFANTDGGAIFNNENSDPTFTSCGFDQNETTYSGGAIYSKEESNPTLTNCVLVYNTAIYGGASFNQSQVTFINCTFANNYAYQGGGLCNEGDADIENCIISGNHGVVGKQIFVKESTTTDINYSDYSNETDDVSALGSMTGANNINTDPLFIGSETGDFRIFGNSPCADAGNNVYCSEAFDIRGNGYPRKISKTDGLAGIIDMGAYEYKFANDPYFPTISITSPTDGSSVYTNPVTISGTANDGEGDLSLVEVKLNDGTWQTATGTDTWTIDLTFEPGKNTILARAKDATDLYSDTATINVLLSIQIINIPKGWSAISFYLKPLVPELPVMMDEIITTNNLVIMLSGYGVYWPSQNYNTIGDWNSLKGYKVKMNNAQEFTVRGDTLASRSINLAKGYHIIPVLSNEGCLIDSVFADPLNDIFFMYDVKTNALYWPQGEIFSLTTLEPGKGYVASFNKAVTLTYPAYSGLKSGVISDNTEPEMNGPWALVRTGDVHFVAISSEAVNKLENASFIGAFDSFGNCIGYTGIDGRRENYLLSVYGNDATTDTKDGAEETEPISFRSYNSSTQTETELIAEFNTSFPNADGLYVYGGQSGIINFKESSTGIGETGIAGDVQIYPNPAKDVLNIAMKGFRTLEGFGTLMTADGKLVKTFAITRNQTQLNVQDVLPGVYILRIENAENVVVKSLVIQ
jgi:predicted outer membrane repeat protein